MKLSNFIEGLRILRPHYPKSEYCLDAEHDTIHLCDTDTPLAKDEVAKLLELGWFQSNGAISARESDDGVEGVYDPEEGWQVFT